ncbi:MAG: ribonuclease Z [Lachnospiraceae bacterium]|nr:ribonuclease Z [Lachnospiraceae bacterium]
MLDVCLLGTGGMMPLPKRWLTSLITRYNGKSIMIDCGEGTQIALREAGWSPKPIDVMCITHFHADHISGLPGMLLTMGNAEKTSPLLMIGPKGLERVVNALRVVAPELPFEIEFHELSEAEERISFEGFHIDAFKVNHNVICYGYNIEVERQGKFDAAKAKELGIPLHCWNKLQHGEICEVAEGRFTPDMVMGAARKGIKVTYSTDTRPVSSIAKYGAGADLMILEGMYGEAEKYANAKAHKHMMMEEAARLAAEAQPKEMWLTHYSPAMPRPDEYMKDVKRIFENSVAARDGRNVTLLFEDE